MEQWDSLYALDSSLAQEAGIAPTRLRTVLLGEPAARPTSQTRRTRVSRGPSTHAQKRIHYADALPPGDGQRGGRARNGVPAMEQRLAEFRASRKRAGLLVEPSTSSQNAQTSGGKVEAATTPKAAPGWLKHFLLWKPRPTSARTLPSPAKVRGGKPWPQGRRRDLPANSGRGTAPRHVVTCRPRPADNGPAHRPRARGAEAAGGGASGSSHLLGRLGRVLLESPATCHH